MDGLKAILATLGIVFAALGSALVVLTVVWLVSNYDVVLLLTAVGVLITAVAFVFMVVFHYRPRRNDDDARIGRRRRLRRRLH